MQDAIIHPGEEANYACYLPSDYLHMLGCTAHFASKCGASESRCGSADNSSGVFSLCRRLTANQFPAIIQNAYFKPSYRVPYYYINESDKEGGRTTEEYRANAIMDPCIDCTDYNQEIVNLLQIENESTSKGKIMEIRCGKNKSYYPDSAFVDYLKIPQKITLTWENINGVDTDVSECEFPNAVAYEIINIFSKLLLENASDERLKTHSVINQTVVGTQTTGT